MDFDINNTITGLPPHQKGDFGKSKSFNVGRSVIRTAEIRSAGERYIFNPIIVNHFIETDDGYSRRPSKIVPYWQKMTKYDRAMEVAELESRWRKEKQKKFPNFNLNMKF